MAKSQGGKTCFVVGPIGQTGSPERDHSDWVLKGILTPVFMQFPDLKLVRADGISDPGLIDSQIIDKLLNAELVVADLTTLNANAFYEIGIRHVVQKPIIHMHLAGLKPPFDVSLFRSIEFRISHPDHLVAAQQQVADAIKAVLEEDYEVENPVTRARGRVQFEATATPGERQLQAQVEQLRREVDDLRAATSGPFLLSDAHQWPTRRGPNAVRVVGRPEAVTSVVQEISRRFSVSQIVEYPDSQMVTFATQLTEHSQDLIAKTASSFSTSAVFYQD